MPRNEPEMPRTQTSAPSEQGDVEDVRDRSAAPPEAAPNEGAGRVGRGRNLDEDIGE